ASYQTQCQREGTESMFNEADNDSLDYQSAIHWISGLNDQGAAMDVLEPDINVADLPSWDMNPDQKLTIRGNDLAGIGGRFADHDYHGYSRPDEPLNDKQSTMLRR